MFRLINLQDLLKYTTNGQFIHANIFLDLAEYSVESSQMFVTRPSAIFGCVFADAFSMMTLFSV